MNLLLDLNETTVEESEVRETVRELSLVSPAFAAEPLTFVVERELTDADMALLASGSRGTSVQERLRATTYRHHLAARLIADGEPNAAVALATGYSPGTIGGLRSDPKFVELVEHYHTQKEQVYLDVHQRLGTLGMSAVDELQDRVDYLRRIGDSPDEDALAQARNAVMSTNLLKSIAEFALDRSLAPSKRSTDGGRGGGNGSAGPSLSVQLNFKEPPSGMGATLDLSAQRTDETGEGGKQS